MSAGFRASLSNKTRGVWAGGVGAEDYYNVIDYITIGSTGNSSDFGDLVAAVQAAAGASSAHGGIA